MGEGASLADLQAQVRAFCEERDWDQFHSPKELAIGVATEAGELLARFRFLSAEETYRLMDDAGRRADVEDELADVLFFVLRFAQLYAVDLARALDRKIAKNALRYPVDKARGRNLKAGEL